MCTKMNGHTSTVLPLLSGVPQGSIVGPIHFLCYIDDIVKVAHDCEIPQGLIVGPILFLCYINAIVIVAYDCEIQISLYAHNAVLYCTNSDRNIVLHSIDIEKLQQLQNRAFRLCFNINVPRDMPIIELHNLASLLPDLFAPICKSSVIHL